MSDIFYLRPVEGPAGPVVADDVHAMASEAGGCFSLHRVDWAESYLATAGDRLLCWYQAPDAESARMALRQLGSDMNAVWAGQVLQAGAGEQPNVLVEQSFAEPQSPAQAEALQSGLQSRLDAAGAALVTGFLSNDGKRLVSACRAVDSQAVSHALGDAGVTVDAVWECEVVVPREPKQ